MNKRERKLRIERLIKEAISRAEADIQKQKLSEGSVNIGVQDLVSADAEKLAKIADKTTVNVVKQVKEEEEVEETEEEIEVEELETEEAEEEVEEKKVKRTQQEEAVFNLSAWAQQLGLDLTDGEEVPGGALRFSYTESQTEDPVSILVFENGLIKISGHVVQDFANLKKIVDFHKSI
jgi:actin-related protein